MGEPTGHYIKWDKPDREKQTLHDLTYMGNKKKIEFIETENKMMDARGW